MALSRTEEQDELARLMAGLLAKHSDSGAVRRAVETERGYDETLWAVLCEQVGVPALAVPERFGGAGFGFAETAVVLEELGRHLTPTPLLGTLLAARALSASGDDDACARLLPGLASGESVGALVWGGVVGSTAAPLAVRADGDHLTGAVPVALDADHADLLVVAADTPEGPALFLVAAGAEGLRGQHRPGLDQTLRFASVEFDRVPAQRLGGEVGATAVLEECHAWGSAAVAALAVGTARLGLDLTVAYSKERVQFGRPIGSFQALKHRMADLLVAVETARSAAMDAALALDERAERAERADLVRRTSVAKAWCTDALTQVAAETVQLHGGIAITWEHDAHLVFKRAHALSVLFGPARQHRAAVLDMVSES